MGVGFLGIKLFVLNLSTEIIKPIRVIIFFLTLLKIKFALPETGSWSLQKLSDLVIYI